MLLRFYDRDQQGRRVVTMPSPEADLAVTEQFRRAGHRPRMAGIAAGGNRLVPHQCRCQHSAHPGEPAVIRACARGGLAGNSPAGRHTGHAIGGCPHGDPFHGLDGVEDT